MSYWPSDKPNKPDPDVIGVPSAEPVDRLTRIANTAAEALIAHPEWDMETSSAFIFVNDGELSGMGALGFDSPTEMLSSLVSRTDAVAKTLGFELLIRSPDGSVREVDK